MRIVFAGTPDFSARILEALIAAGHEITAVICQPDRPRGRGQKALFGPVKEKALAHGLPVFQPDSLKSADTVAALAALHADVWVVVAYGALIPPAILSAPRFGCVNIHASLLPRWRGAAPIQRAILAGDTKTGISIMQMEAGLDTGPVLLRASLPISDQDTTGSLHDALAQMGAELILQVLQDLPKRLATAEVQPSTGVTYAEKIRKEEARIDWSLPAIQLSRVIRAFTPSPGAWFMLGEDRIRVGQAELASKKIKVEPGKVLEVHPKLVVGTGEGALHLLMLQRAGGRMLPAEEFVRGMSVTEGQYFE